MTVVNDALTSLDSIKEWAGITGTKSPDEQLLEHLINHFTKMFCNYCEVTSFKAANYTEYSDGNGTPYLFVKNIPLNSITNIWDDADWNWTSSDLIDSDDYRIADSRIVVHKSYWERGLQNIKITYNGGYSTIPVDITQACNEEVYRRYKRRREMDVLIKTLEDGSLHFPPTTLLASTKQVLSKYMRLRANG
jgi:hypothetical protein